METALTSILLATDGSQDAALAAGAAAHLSEKTGARLYVAHAWRPMTQRAGHPEVVWTDYAHLYERQARKVLASEVDAIEALGCAVEEARLLKGPPIDAILDLCEEFDPGLVVVGSQGMGPLRRTLLGSVSEGIVHHARRPVLVVRGGERAWPPERIVIGDDGSDDSRRAAELAASIGGDYGAGVVLVRAYPKPPEPLGGWSAADRRKLDESKSREEEALNRRAERFEHLFGSRTESKVIGIEPAPAILDISAGRDGGKALLAVGSRGLDALSRVRLGSVSTKVLRAAEGPVLIHPRASGLSPGHADRSSTAPAVAGFSPRSLE